MKRNILQTDIYAPSDQKNLRKTLRNIYWHGCSACGMWKKRRWCHESQMWMEIHENHLVVLAGRSIFPMLADKSASHRKERQLTKITLIITRKKHTPHYPICGHDTHTHTHTHTHTRLFDYHTHIKVPFLTKSRWHNYSSGSEENGPTTVLQKRSLVPSVAMAANTSKYLGLPNYDASNMLAKVSRPRLVQGLYFQYMASSNNRPYLPLPAHFDTVGKSTDLW
jgi:hypothetical protein